MGEVRHLADALKTLGVRAKVDDRDGMSPGWKFNEWERKGVPLRIELGPRDVGQGTGILADRLSGEKRSVRLEALPDTVVEELPKFQAALFERARAFREEHTFEAHSYDELREMVEHGFVYATHFGDPESERIIQEETKATVRCIPLEGPSAEGTSCVHTGRESGYARKVIFARAY